MRLPDFMVGGVRKCGTTSLVDALRTHPRLFIPARKELAFYDRADWESMLDWYAEQFAEAAPDQLVGEATPHYLDSAEACRRIHQTQPAVKLVFLLRNPVERAQSHYWARVRFGREERSLLEVLQSETASLDADPQADSGYLVVPGLYGRNLRRYLDRFGPEQIRVILLEDLRRDPDDELAELQRFLGVEEASLELPWVNEASETRNRSLQHAIEWLSEFQGIGKRALRTVVPSELRRRIRFRLYDLNKKPESKPVLDSETQLVLTRIYEEDLHIPADQIQRPVTEWLRDRDVPANVVHHHGIA